MGVRLEEHLAIRFHFGAMHIPAQNAHMRDKWVGARVRLVVGQDVPQSVWIGVHEFSALESDVHGASLDEWAR
jgi:hypothetical protein